MIYDELSRLSNYYALLDNLDAVDTLLGSRTWEDSAVGSIPTENPNISCTLVQYSSSSLPKVYEVFEEKTRVHVMLTGEELMALSWREHARSLRFDEEGAATLEADPIGVIHAKAGHFALFMPGEPHTVGMEIAGKSVLVRKLIFTISD